MSERIQYRTADGIIHLWTQGEIDQHIQATHVSIVDRILHPGKTVTMLVEQMGHVTLPHFEDEPISVQEEATLTVKMLYDLLYRRATPVHPLDHETVQDLLSRIDVMGEPLKELVQAMEVKR